mgnify:CR=1 FL=1
MTKYTGPGWLIVSAALFLAGCATPQARIQRNQQMYASFPPEVKRTVREGKIELGYTRDMVYIALGSPDRRYERVTDAGTVEVWAYTDTELTHARVHRAGWWPWWGPWYGPDPYYGSVAVPREYEELRVEFRDARVTAIERAQR